MVDANPAFECLRGYSREELLTLEPRKLIHPDSRPHMERFLEQVKRGEPFQAEVRGLHRDGSLLDLQVHGVPVHYHGSPHLLAVVRDITESKRRSVELKRSEERLRTTVEAALDCIISTDESGRITGFNPAAEQCFGIRAEEAIGRMLADLLVPERHRQRYRDGLERHLRTGEGRCLGQRIEVDAMRADGSEFPAELAISVAQGPEGNVYVGYLRDISERRRAEQERSELERQLRQAQKMEAIGHLTGGIAHDFNNILTSILGYAVMASERADADNDKPLARYLEQITRAGERARDLIRQMLTFSRGQKGEPRPLDPTALVRESVKLYGSSFPSSLEIVTDLGVGTSPVLADPIQVEQVLMNLCINARDAMEGVGRVSISVGEGQHQAATCASCRKTFCGRFVELAVTDNGTGISPAVLERMFEPFFTTKEVGRGSGMGLSSTHGIVHEMGGHLVVETTPGAGATFRVLLPPAEEGLAAPRPRDGPAASNAQRYCGHLLVVDDESSVREFMRELLEGRGFSVILASDGFEALGKLEAAAEPVDVVITDQTMPRVTGLELAALLHVRRPGLPVVLYTGFSEDVSAERARAAGIRAVLAKPLNVPELFETVLRLIDTPCAPC
jgi:PAS domain S-box-containing protein